MLIENNMFDDIEDIDLLLNKETVEAIIESEVANTTWDYSNFKTIVQIPI